MLMHERDELIERLWGSRRGDSASQQPFALPLKQRQVDVATSPAILQDELVEVRVGM
jgi:hypothetical protein